MYLPAPLASQENQEQSNPEVYILHIDKTYQYRKQPNKRSVQKITRNSVLCLQDKKCKELSLNHCILILQINDPFLPLQSNQFIKPAHHTQ